MARAWISAGLVGLGLALAVPAAAKSDLPLDARLSANAPADWDPSAGVQVRPGEAGDLQERIADSFTAEIEKRGWPSDDRAPATLVFRYGVQATADPNRAPVQLRGGIGSSGDEDAEVVMRLNLLDKDGAPPRTNLRNMTVTVSDRRNRVLWQAQATASVGKAGDLALAQALVPKVLDYLGRDAFDEPLR